MVEKDLDRCEQCGVCDEIYKIDPGVQVCVLDYRREFRRMSIVKPTYREMEEVWKVLHETGLETKFVRPSSDT